MRRKSTRADETRRSTTRGQSRPQQADAPTRGHPFETLHRSVGNQAVQALHERGTLQAKLAVSSPTDPAEREAERVASEVMRSEASAEETDGGNAPAIHRSASAGVAGESLTGDAEDQVRSSLDSGKPLPEATRSSFEARFDRDFSDVRVHTGPDADEAARSINAEAFTMGSDVAFAGGNYDPNSRSGQQLLAHELTHVVQQGGGTERTIHRQDEKANDSETEEAGPGDADAEAAAAGDTPLQTYNHGTLAGVPVVIHDGFVDAMDTITGYASQENLTIHITQSFRESGQDVEGAIVEPASRSNHLVGHAIDMNLRDSAGRFHNSGDLSNLEGCSEAVQNFIQAIRNDAGLRWGGDFGTPDPVHIDDGYNQNHSEQAYDQLFTETQRAYQQRGN